MPAGRLPAPTPRRSQVEAGNCRSQGQDMDGVKNAFVLLFNSLRNDLFQEEGFLTICTLSFALVRNDQKTIALRAGLLERHLPRSEIAIRIIHTTIEGPALACLARHKLAAIFRT